MKKKANGKKVKGHLNKAEKHIDMAKNVSKSKVKKAKKYINR